MSLQKTTRYLGFKVHQIIFFVKEIDKLFLEMN